MIKLKICMLGAFAVGKTSLVSQYVHSIFSEKYHTTVGVKIDKKPIQLDNQNANLIVWDLHGEDDFQSVNMSYLRGAAGCVYVVDGTRATTLDTALRLEQKVRESIGDVAAMWAINKFDLDRQWELTDTDMATLTHDHRAIIHTSAKSGQAVHEVFNRLARQAMGAP